MEDHFGRDFSHVRLHQDTQAARSAAEMRALAYTFGRDVVFGAGQYAPATTAGRSLLVHELTHVAQQTAARSRTLSPFRREPRAAILEREAETASRTVLHVKGPGSLLRSSFLFGRPSLSPSEAQLRCAVLNVGSLTIQIEYGDIINIPAADYLTTIESLFASWTGSPASVIHASVSALTSDQQQWVLFGMDLLRDNTNAAHSVLNRAQAVQRLIARAPSSTTRPLGTAATDFEHEVLQVSGWFEVALAAPLTAPTGTTRATLQGLYNPPSATSSTTLRVRQFRAELVPALRAFLVARDPGSWSATRTQPLATTQTIGDVVQAHARVFFAPYANTAINNAYARNWQYSANIFSVTATVPSRAERIGHLLNRAERVGRESRPGGSIFSRVNFDSSDAGHRRELLNLVTSMESDPALQPVLDRLVQHTGRTERSPLRVGISTEFDAGTETPCQARWQTLRTLSHELVHALVHPRFSASATGIGFRQIVREGFTEVLGVQLYDSLRSTAASTPSFKARLEAGIATSCPPAPPTTIRYGQAGQSAEQIRSTVHDDNFRAAYFLGAVDLVGL